MHCKRSRLSLCTCVTILKQPYISYGWVDFIDAIDLFPLVVLILFVETDSDRTILYRS